MASKSKKSGIAPGYLHGYDRKEQERLYEQARFLAPTVHEKVDFSSKTNLLEVGCGVGAQTEILLKKFKNLKIHGIDASPAQIKTAKQHLNPWIRSGQVNLTVADALHLPFSENSFDSAFICWFLEHVQNPVEILREVRRVLEVGGTLFCSEVLNATFYVHPYSPATLEYWFKFNDHQWELKGDPFVGAKLANYLLQAGFQNITTDVRIFHYDDRSPKNRALFIEYWTHLLLSGAPSLIKAGKVNQKLIDQMTRELKTLKEDPESVFFYAFVQAKAQAF